MHLTNCASVGFTLSPYNAQMQSTLTLTPTIRRAMRAEAHGLSPVVMIGNSGLSLTVISEINLALDRHELIKIKAQSDDRVERAAWMVEICAQLRCAAVQQIGKILVVYRQRPEDPNAPVQAERVPLSPSQRRKLWARNKEPGKVLAKHLQHTAKGSLRGKQTGKAHGLAKLSNNDPRNKQLAEAARIAANQTEKKRSTGQVVKGRTNHLVNKLSNTRRRRLTD